MSWALSTAEAMHARGDQQDAIKWLRRAAEAASAEQADDRALELAKAAADLAAASGDAGAPPETGEPFPALVAPPDMVVPAEPAPVETRVVAPFAAPQPEVEAVPAPAFGVPRPHNQAPRPAFKSVTPAIRTDGPAAPVPARSVEGWRSALRARTPSGPPPEGPAPLVEPAAITARAPEPVDQRDTLSVPMAQLAAALLEGGDTPTPSPWDIGPQERASAAAEAIALAAAPADRPSESALLPQASQAVRVVVWRTAHGVHVAPEGTQVAAISVAAMLVALDPSVDLAAWIAGR